MGLDRACVQHNTPLVYAIKAAKGIITSRL